MGWEQASTVWMCEGSRAELYGKSREKSINQLTHGWRREAAIYATMDCDGDLEQRAVR